MWVKGLSDRGQTTLSHRRFWHHDIRQGLLVDTGPDSHADPAVSREVTVHRRFYLFTGHGLNLLVFVAEGQRLAKTVDDGQFAAHFQIAGRELWQSPQQVLFNVVQFCFAGPVFQKSGKQGFDVGQGTLAVTRRRVEVDDPGR